MNERITIDVINNRIVGELENDFEWLVFRQIHSKQDLSFLQNHVMIEAFLTSVNAVYYEDEVLLYLRELSSYRFTFKEIECRFLVNNNQEIVSLLLATSDLKILFLLLKRLQSLLFG